jgi:hypothetical protein
MIETAKLVEACFWLWWQLVLSHWIRSIWRTHRDQLKANKILNTGTILQYSQYSISKTNYPQKSYTLGSPQKKSKSGINQLLLQLKANARRTRSFLLSILLERIRYWTEQPKCEVVTGENTSDLINYLYYVHCNKHTITHDP